jgi:ribosomal protein L39E
MAGFDNSGLKQETIEPAPCFSIVIMNALTLTQTILMVSRKMKSLKRLREIPCWVVHTTLKCGVGKRILTWMRDPRLKCGAETNGRLRRFSSSPQQL